MPQAQEQRSTCRKQSLLALTICGYCTSAGCQECSSTTQSLALDRNHFATQYRGFAEVKLRQRVAKDISQRSITASMLGTQWSMPVALAPTGLAGMQRADGEILAAQAAEEFGVPFTLSTMSICSIEDVAAHTQKPFWFQLYVMKDRTLLAH